MKLGLDVTFTLRMIIMFIYRLTVTHDFGCNARQLPIAIWIWITDGRWLIVTVYYRWLFPFRLPIPYCHFEWSLSDCHCECSLPLPLLVAELQITDGHFDHLLRVTASYWLPFRMNDLPMARWPIVIYWWRTIDCHFDYPWRRTNCHFEFPIAGCSLHGTK